MSNSAIAVLHVLRQLAKEEDGRRFTDAGNLTIARQCGYCTRQVVRALNRLEALQMITIDRREPHPILDPTGRTIVLQDAEAVTA